MCYESDRQDDFLRILFLDALVWALLEAMQVIHFCRPLFMAVLIANALQKDHNNRRLDELVV